MQVYTKFDIFVGHNGVCDLTKRNFENEIGNLLTFCVEWNEAIKDEKVKSWNYLFWSVSLKTNCDLLQLKSLIGFVGEKIFKPVKKVIFASFPILSQNE